MERIRERLFSIYNNQNVEITYSYIMKAIHQTKQKPLKMRKQYWDEKDVVLITYGDQFKEQQQPALQTLKKIYDHYFSTVFEIVHILPFYPYSSDDGFSVIDYKEVSPVMGNWEDIQQLSASARLMVDLVCNHVSAKSEWFQEYLKGNPVYRDYFIEVDPTVDLSGVTRPRTHPLLTKFTLSTEEEKHIWTTFSEDQIDLNFSNPAVLAEIIDALLFYIEQGAEYIRLDAVGFIWKEIGTSSIHHEKAHNIIKLFREVVDEAAKGTLLITETNVPHEDNISYFGNGRDEAHLVYQFPLPPLILYSIHYGDASALSKWAKSFPHMGKETAFYNFLASHDGIGLNPIRGIIPENKIIEMAEALKKEGALISYKKNEDGKDVPYEINATYFDALNRKSDEEALRIKRFLVAHSILLGLPGIPAIYIQSVLGARNDYDGVKKTGAARSINREKYWLGDIEQELLQSGTVTNQVFQEMIKMIGIRKAEPLFHPNAAMKMLDYGESIFAFYRINKSKEQILLLHNLANQSVVLPVVGHYCNILTQQNIKFEESVELEPYQFFWLKPID
ncbi:sugar phosphorylase [Planococcus shenhongbingii]|uniref:sugar phosphorylase n=1 Tax=Planococcus shenhongbingii TaxID=3058398 RepID=UPI002638B53F|nr:sugar phosphorylase [Planococcus sp. N016]WKA59442.1 sugar phosphorylase [Planococcus sp. N016]